MHNERLSYEAEHVGEHVRADATYCTFERARTRALYVEHGG